MTYRQWDIGTTSRIRNK